MKKTEEKKSGLNVFFQYTLMPVILMIGSTNVSIFLVYLVVEKKSNFHVIIKEGFNKFALEAWKESFCIDWEVVTLIGGMTLWSALCLIFLPGKMYYGPVTLNCYRPQYVKSGFKYYILTMTVAAILLSMTTAWYWYQKFHIIIAHLIIFGYTISLLLYLKGHFYPSLGEHGSSGNAIFDFYWGLELYPRLGKWFDIKQWTNCRFGMMIMQLTVLLCFKAQLERNGWNWGMATTSILQTVYLAKFYWWEDGYMHTIDIITDRAGYYICWGCICFVPSFYTLTSLYMVENAPNLQAGIAIIILTAGIISILLNYWSDYQKQLVRNTDGKCIIWKAPPTVIRASYRDTTGITRHTILLASGFWGIARHFNYVFEILIHFFWELPSLFYSILPYIHGIFLVILLIHRTYRDDKKCHQKYGRYWQQYCQICPYKMIPGIF